jgi:hypothetical protein
MIYAFADVELRTTVTYPHYLFPTYYLGMTKVFDPTVRKMGFTI